MSDDTLSPIDVLINFFSDWNLSQIIWILIIIGLAFAVRIFIFRERKSRKPQKGENVAAWLYSLISWFFVTFLMFIWGMFDLQKNPISSPFAAITSAFIIFLSSYLFFKDGSEKQVGNKNKIVSGGLLLFVLSGIITLMILDKKALGYAIIMGSLLGGIFALLHSAYKIFRNPIETETEIETKTKPDDW